MGVYFWTLSCILLIDRPALKWTACSLEKTLMLGKIEGRRGRQRMRWLDGISSSVDRELGRSPGDGEGQGSLCCGPWGQRARHGLATDQQQHRIDTACADGFWGAALLMLGCINKRWLNGLFLCHFPLSREVNTWCQCFCCDNEIWNKTIKKARRVHL